VASDCRWMSRIPPGVLLVSTVRFYNFVPFEGDRAYSGIYRKGTGVTSANNDFDLAVSLQACGAETAPEQAHLAVGVLLDADVVLVPSRRTRYLSKMEMEAPAETGA
jgi:hypothetical protein